MAAAVLNISSVSPMRMCFFPKMGT
jgi:hypothetical protein